MNRCGRTLAPFSIGSGNSFRAVACPQFLRRDDVTERTGSGAQSHVVYGRNEPALAHYHKSICRALGLSVDEGSVRTEAE
jgi:hypothetical protein